MTENVEFPFVLATPQHRLAGRVVDGAFYIVTLGIGWFIWNLVVWGQGQTPGHQVLKMRIYSMDTKKPASWGHMALRQFLLPLAFGMIPFVFIIVGTSLSNNDGSSGLFVVLFGYLLGLAAVLTDGFWIFRGNERQRLVDKFARTAVLNECIKMEAVTT